MKNEFVRSICRMLIVCIGAFPFSAHAGMIGADKVLSVTQEQGARDKLRGLIGRSEVRDQFVSIGIDPSIAEERVSAMTDAEIANIAGKIDQLPAGGLSGWAVLATLAIVGLIWYYWVK